MSYPQQTETSTQEMQQPQSLGINSAPPPSYSAPVGEKTEGHFAPAQTQPQPQQTYPQFQSQTHPQQGFQQIPLRNTYQIATPLASLQAGPAPVDYPVCRVREMTRCEFRSGGTTHASAALLCFCFCVGCIPYLADWFKECEHKCGNCGALLAGWHRSGRTEVVAHR